MQDVKTVAELYQKLSNDGKEDVTSIVCFKAIWCRSCARLQYRIKKAAEKKPSVQFLNVDISDQKGEFYEYCVENGLQTIPYCIVYVNDEKVSEGRWSEIRTLKV